MGYPLPVVLDGEELPRCPWLAGAVHIEDWQGCRIGVFDSHASDWPLPADVRINFHGLAVATNMPMVTAMPTRHVARHTRLHLRLLGPHKITAYPHGFHDWPKDLTEPVWEPNALVIRDGFACIIRMDDQPTLDDALDACWQHFGSLPTLARAA